VHISAILDETNLNREIEAGLISRRVNADGTRFIYNYTPAGAHQNDWSHERLLCRGMITDAAGNVFGRPLDKFFNLNERPNTQLSVLPLGPMFACDKMDGSLGLCFLNDDGSIAVSTRGSFKSIMAQWATEWINTAGNCNREVVHTYIDAGYTLIVEIISPVSRIVIDYKGDHRLVLLAVRHIESGEEADPMMVELVANECGLDFAAYREISSLDSLIVSADVLTGIEGWVVRWPNHDDLRVKIKTSEYYALHRLITGCSVKLIKEYLEIGTYAEYRKGMPDFIGRDADRVAGELNARWGAILRDSAIAYTRILNAGATDRKSFAQRLTAEKRADQAIIFNLYAGNISGEDSAKSGKKIVDIAWKLVTFADIPMFSDIPTVGSDAVEGDDDE
jgi:RNA ligase